MPIDLDDFNFNLTFTSDIDLEVFPSMSYSNLGQHLCKFVLRQVVVVNADTIHTKSATYVLPYVKHALNVCYKTYVKPMDRAPYRYV